MNTQTKSRMRAFAEGVLSEGCCPKRPPFVSPIDVMRKLQQELGQGVAVSVNLRNNIQAGDFYQAHINLEPDDVPKTIEVFGHTLELQDVKNMPHYYTYVVVEKQ